MTSYERSKEAHTTFPSSTSNNGVTMVYAGQTMDRVNDYPTNADFKAVGYERKSKARARKPAEYYFFKRKETVSLCKVRGCNRPVHAKHYCKKHYRERLDLRYTKLKIRKAVTLCEKCDKPAVAKGLCQYHYNKWKREQERNSRPPITEQMVKDVDNPYPYDEWLYPDQVNRYLFNNKKREAGRKKN